MNLSRLFFRLLLGRRLPTTSGSLTAPGLRQPVLIHRDRWGIPYIEAENEPDAWYGLGFCHGQDRTFQLESLLRTARGTIAEWVGPAGLPFDRLARRVGFAPAAARQLTVVDPDIREILTGYAAGVTAGGSLGLSRRPHEFVLLGGTPTPWSAADVLAILKLQSFVLASNWDVELARLKILSGDGPEALQALDPTYATWLPVTAPPATSAGPALDRLAVDVRLLVGTGPGGGSNNWVLAGTHTATGRPLLANDPHLASTLPPHWYLAHLRTPQWAVAGASFAGGAAIAIGHNGFAAWGLTLGLLDNTDLFTEEIGPDGRSVRQGDRFVPCEVRTERIAVKGELPVVEEVLVTPRGPVIGPALQGEVGAVSLRAVWLDLLPVRGLLGIHRARGFEEFRRSFARWPAMSLNMVYADESGTVGWQLGGHAPRRRRGYGTLPLPGRDPAAGWEEALVPFEDMPHLSNPPTGFLATANNQPVPDGSGPFLGIDWLEGYRQARIVEVLKSRAGWDVAGTQALQMDQQSIPWREMSEVVLAAPAKDPAARQALELLRAWDGRIAADSPAATLYELFVSELAGRAARAKAPRTYRWALGQGFTSLGSTLFADRRVGHLVRLLREQPAGWFPRPWPEEVADALATVVRNLQGGQGTDPAGWAWGHMRPLRLRHAFGERKPWGRVFNLGPFPWGGDNNTVGQASVEAFQPLVHPGFIASLRMVVDVGNWQGSRFVLPGGQSGNPLSPHYDDQLPLWQRGEGIAIAWSRDEVKSGTVETLRLSPG